MQNSLKHIDLQYSGFLNTPFLWFDAAVFNLKQLQLPKHNETNFEGAIKDHIVPLSMHLSENQTNIHIEARVNWDIKNIPQGAPLGGFIPYLHINAKVVNQTNGLSTFIDLLPHINLIDNFYEYQ